MLALTTDSRNGSCAVNVVASGIEALCLTTAGRALVRAYQPLRALVPMLTHSAYATVVSPADFGVRLDELVRHMDASLRPAALDSMLAVLRVLCAVGGDSDALAWVPQAVIAQRELAAATADAGMALADPRCL